MAKKERRSKVTEFEALVVASCLAGKIVRNEYGAETAPAEIAGEVKRWLTIAGSAEQALAAPSERTGRKRRG